MLGPKGCRNFLASPAVVEQFVVGKCSGIALLVDVAFGLEAFCQGVSLAGRESAFDEFLAYVVAALFALRTAGGGPKPGLGTGESLHFLRNERTTNQRWKKSVDSQP